MCDGIPSLPPKPVTGAAEPFDPPSCLGHHGTDGTITPWHAPHTMDPDPERIFETFQLVPSAPLEALRERMLARGDAVATQKEHTEEVFRYVRDHRPVYARCAACVGMSDAPRPSLGPQGTVVGPV